MSSGVTLMASRGISDQDGRLLSADGPLADLQRRCGGHIPGLIAVPELLDIVRQASAMKLGLAREFSAFDGDERVSGFVRVNPQTDDETQPGFELLIENWKREADGIDENEQAELNDAIDRAASEFSARLDAQQRIQAFSTTSKDLAGLVEAIRAEPGKLWSDYVELQSVAHRQPLHWRLLDNVRCAIAGSDRSWHARLIPIGTGSASPIGFELLLIAQEPRQLPKLDDDEIQSRPSLIGEALTPALREPITRIIGNAETIRGKLAGPVRQEYSEYAGDIAAAGQHLLSLLDDLADLAAVEADDFEVAQDEVELGDVARRAAAMLSQKAQAKSIAVDVPSEEEQLVASGEFRRILQIIINLLGNAIAYSPNESGIALELSRDGQGRVCLSVADKGPGLDAVKLDRIFNKFERLGRDDETGSGLGLYISRKLALAMNGELLVESEEGRGARFTLALTEAG